ncbi:tight adherence protein C [Variovorax boronicumulans]|uniref:Tight adherence protein C n=1 Tax=Variovorax boronicumulans TaxID=436515 RepID=A0AAW8CTC4_9BURK|nr:type II secretion system F family protein [Variovorax boronicumulans]MDP9892521.1 tight adherence protein C [Variovorax boronicumulans]MDQ0038214.1 tight adherence protein C [Variovorax boronicumulans]MDQ0051999.1 tight adherence protein C [Variovorax boronicumulans]
MTLTPGTLTAISLALLALGLLVAGGAMIATEFRRARSGQAIGKAIERGTTAFAGVPADPEVDLGQPYKSDVELPFHWLKSPLGRALVADEDRNLIDRCGMSSQRTQLIFLVTRIVLALLLPAVAFVLWSPGYKQNLLFPVLAALFVVGFMSPKWILGRIAANRRERVAKELPLFVDLLKLLQGVGMSLDQSLQIMAADFSHVLRVLGYELTLANRQYSQGRTREHSLHRLATLHKDENLRGLVTLLVQVDRHGGAVQEPLRTFSDRLREHRRSEMKERIGKITVKMTAVMVTTLLPALVIVTAGPGFIAIFRALGSTAK